MTKKRRKKKLRIKWSRVFIALTVVCLICFGIYKGTTFVLGQIFSFFSSDSSIVEQNDKDDNISILDNVIATVIVDPGHGGMDAGTKKGDLYEKTITLNVANKIKEILETKNIKVILTRSDDSTPDPNSKVNDLKIRAGMSAKYSADAYISIHVNAFEDSNDISGFEFYSRNNESKPLAQSVSHYMEELNLTKIRSIQDGQGLQVLRDNTVPAILIEMGYINGSDYSFLSNEFEMNRVAEAIAKGIEDYISEKDN